MSPLLTEIVEESVRLHAELDVVARFDTREFPEEKLRETSPDLILIGLHPGEADQVARHLLAIVPLAKVIAFSSNASRGYIHEMRPRRSEFVDISPEALIEELLRPNPMRKRSRPPSQET